MVYYYFQRKVNTMKIHYTIGETASLLGVTTQTLRYYDKIGLLSPDYVDLQTGYRYYRYQQFHIIDRIRYLQSFGMSLDDIRAVIQNGQNDCLLRHLQKERERMEQELQALLEKRRNLDWYINYCSYMDAQNIADSLYKIYQPERYIVSCPCYYKERLENMEIRLAQMKSRPEYRNESFRRQYGYCMDIPSLFRGEFYPKQYFTYLSKKPNLPEDLYCTLPAGEYLCMRTQLLHEDWDADLLSAYFFNLDQPKLAVALEFEDNLIDWSDAWYEVQILL